MIVMTYIIVSVTETNDTNNIVERKDISIRRVQLTATKNPETWPTPEVLPPQQGRLVQHSPTRRSSKQGRPDSRRIDDRLSNRKQLQQIYSDHVLVEKTVNAILSFLSPLPVQFQRFIHQRCRACTEQSDS